MENPANIPGAVDHDRAMPASARKPYTAPVFVDHGTIESATRGFGRPANPDAHGTAPLVSGADALGYF